MSPSIEEVPAEVEAFYNIENRSQRIRFAGKKKSEGVTIEKLYYYFVLRQKSPVISCNSGILTKDKIFQSFGTRKMK